MKKLVSLILVFVLSLVLFAGCGAEKEPQIVDPVPETFKGLVLRAPADVSVVLYTGFKEGEVVPAAETYETEQYDYYCYPGLYGAYRAKCSGSGYYTVTKNIAVSEQTNEAKTVIDVDPGKKAGTHWEPTSLGMFTNEILEGDYNSDISQWPDYAEAFSSPYFTEDHALHQITTQEQMVRYIQGLDDADDDLYIYSAGKSGLYQHDIPMVIFTQTDLSGAKTVEEVAQLLDNGKLTVMYRAQMHGNEPAGGEGALAMIGWLDGTLGPTLLDKLNICIIPRQNPDGGQNYERTVMGDIDPNRDSLRLKTPEIQEFTRICNLLNPYIIIDGHEYNAKEDSQVLTTGELLLGLGYTTENTSSFVDISHSIGDSIFADLTANGLDYRYYSNHINSVNGNISRAYWSRQGTLFFLLETRGIGCGLAMYERRIAVHVISTTTILRYAAENADQVRATVDAEKQYIVESGAVYNTKRLLALETKKVDDPLHSHDGIKHDQLTGTGTPMKATPTVSSGVARSRPAPTAYVMPAGEGYTEAVLNLMDRHNIAYTFIPEGSTVRLQQYTGTVEQAGLTAEKSVKFEKGAYVFCCNQVTAGILSLLMEPDVTDGAEQKGTLAQQGYFTATDGYFPIYRYIHDLNADGFIDYQ